ncbi:MAG: type II secretion system F family protein [Candidatus Omnitrophica bacterium]|nr:type II secretion system F family protein [Candidatus Omnitrophota bacterium]MDD5653585.1 type II secretion system F family protein [Candidatus Omnitrophota bacterium]
MLTIISFLILTSLFFVVYQFVYLRRTEETHLPSQIFDDDEAKFKYPGQMHKAWTPLSSKYKSFEKSIPVPLNLRHKLVKAGSPCGILEFFAFVALAVLMIPIVVLIIVGDRFSVIGVICCGAGLGLVIPIIWLNKKINKRQFQMKRDLPNVIDLLNICVSGGLDFMLAVNRVVRDLKPCDLTRELAEVYRETQMGATRREALKNLAWRVDMAEMHSFVRTLIQADRMGTSIGDALKLQSEEIKIKRFQRGEAMALKAPIKLLFPLFVFIMPVVLIIVAGPIMLTFLRGNMNFGF